jgi:hypothetical protein
MIQVPPTATCEHTLQHTRRWKKELDRFWLIQSTECIILMYIPHRIPDHVCVTANELLLTYPLITTRRTQSTGRQTLQMWHLLWDERCFS